LVKQFRGDLLADIDLTIAMACQASGRSVPDGRASRTRNWKSRDELLKAGRAEVLFEEAFADVWRNAQRRRSAYVGSWIAQLLRRRNDAGPSTAGDSRLRTADVR
jgi:hypothetical protein